MKNQDYKNVKEQESVSRERPPRKAAESEDPALEPRPVGEARQTQDEATGTRAARPRREP